MAVKPFLFSFETLALRWPLRSRTLQGVPLEDYWSRPSDELLQKLNTTPNGLTSERARQQLAATGPNTLTAQSKSSAIRLLLAQFNNPLLLILVVAASVSAFVRE